MSAEVTVNERRREMIDIKGLSKAEVLAALYNGSHPQGLGFLSSRSGEMTEDDAQALINECVERQYRYHLRSVPPILSFDYVYGRVLKVDLTRDEFDPWGYDRDLGQGHAWEVIDALKKRKSHE